MSMRLRQILVTSAFCLAFVCAVAATLGWVPEAVAQGGLQANIFLLQKGVPSKLTERGVLRFAKANKVSRLGETRDRPIPERMWKATMVAAFNRPIGDTEFELLFYDTQSRDKKFIAPITVFISDRNQRTIVHKLRLKRPDFEPNKRMEMVVTVRRREVAKRSFQILGERVQHSGEVSFTADEAR